MEPASCVLLLHAVQGCQVGQCTAGADCQCCLLWPGMQRCPWFDPGSVACLVRIACAHKACKSPAGARSYPAKILHDIHPPRASIQQFVLHSWKEGLQRVQTLHEQEVWLLILRNTLALPGLSLHARELISFMKLCTRALVFLQDSCRPPNVADMAPGLWNCQGRTVGYLCPARSATTHRDETTWLHEPFLPTGVITRPLRPRGSGWAVGASHQANRRTGLTLTTCANCLLKPAAQARPAMPEPMTTALRPAERSVEAPRLFLVCVAVAAVTGGCLLRCTHRKYGGTGRTDSSMLL